MFEDKAGLSPLKITQSNWILFQFIFWINLIKLIKLINLYQQSKTYKGKKNKLNETGAYVHPRLINVNLGCERMVTGPHIRSVKQAAPQLYFYKTLIKNFLYLN